MSEAGFSVDGCCMAVALPLAWAIAGHAQSNLPNMPLTVVVPYPPLQQGQKLSGPDSFSVFPKTENRLLRRLLSIQSADFGPV